MYPAALDEPLPLARRRASSTPGAPWLVVLACVLGGLLGCAGADPGKPGWVSAGRAPDTMPPERFIIGVGSGRNTRVAATNARGEIARTLRAHIDQQIHDRQRSDSHQGNEITSQNIRADTRISTNVILQGVRIDETWQDPATGLYWALAVLDKAQERERIRDLRGRESERLRRAMAAAEQARGPEEEIAALRDAVDAVRAMDEPGAGQILLGGKPLMRDPSLPTLAALSARLSALRGQLPVAIEAREVDLASGRALGLAEPLEDELSEAVTALGFPILRGSSPASPLWLHVRSEIGIALQPELSQKFFVYRWEGELELRKATADGRRVVAVVSEHGRVTHSIDRLAQLHARREAQTRLAETLAQKLVELTSGGE